MACRGVFFAIDEKTVQTLKNEMRSSIVGYIQEEIEEVYFADLKTQVAEIDKAWDAIHRAFSESELEFEPTTGTYPSNMIIMGGEALYGDSDKEDDYIITLKNPSVVADIYIFLSKLTEAEFRAMYFKIDEAKYEFPTDEQDFKYTWDWLIGTIDFWKNASEKNLAVIFNVDQ
jgi:hypothetical protein